MKKPKLKHWTNVSDHMAHHEKYPSVSLTDQNTGYGLSCQVTPGGNIKLSTHAGGGHGEGTYDDKGRTAQEWGDLIAEADEVRRHYWGHCRLERLVSLRLSFDLLEKLNEVLSDHQDDGPFGEGWASDELDELRSLTDKAVKDAKAG